ncbi:carbamoyl-phosphate synthase arginine-specific large chain [Halobacillus andaensis]|uniref:Carbamoyl-phosphate synthase arginine-specific large chain n=1 Tax=Halobacillus andaensis TaxID=1176239 RepID=A0A917B4N3_HALAA|nr:carbamoyl phosphate synthase large subunit [Halobacillus andaensis]MBP2004628.1 carbamoyl-phosphate synthase large subunit [Halobacillus andaensis]GGF20190.1 carbamoyl-phosphate synthase arginine-specific large chain [Halobacillus andaensis]
MPKKVLVIGSGPIVIGQAAEFDYSGTQGCLALKEEGHEVVLVNNNPATIMTDNEIADKVYCEPLTVQSVEAIIKKEKPDSVLAGLGGQTGLNLAVEMNKHDLFAKYDLELLGTSVQSIQQGEDRELFRELMDELQQPVPESEVIASVEEALNFTAQYGYPVISRPAYTLGGRGGGIVDNEEELTELVANGLKASPIGQVIIEKSIAGFKEVEYEVMRDVNGTCISVCNMENFDPVGVHTGDSIVVAPSQTLTDQEYQMLRTAAFTIISALDVIGGCNVQLAIDPYSKKYYVIEVNPRVSRSSALASKATGYPIAKMATKLALGFKLDELINPLTGTTYASFEPALDYVVVKFPRWPFDKFSNADRKLGTKMKATGEVMAIDRTLEGAFQKAVASLDQTIPEIPEEQFEEHLTKPTDLRYFTIVEMLKQGYTIKEIHEKTAIDLFFLQVVANLVQMEQQIKTQDLDAKVLKTAKVQGFTDKKIAELKGISETEVKQIRTQFEVTPSYKMVDTCAAEFEAATNYVYTTYAGTNEIEPLSANKKALIVGSGPIRIGQGVEFDYSAVKAIQSLQKLGWTTVMINNNPETVSTDYTTADRLYFDPINKEVIESIVEHEGIDLVFTQFGGQTAINIADELSEAGIPLAGVNVDTIAQLEDREQFYSVLQSIDVPHIPGEMCHTMSEALEAASSYEYPLLCRPSYVIGGQGMVKVENEQQLKAALEETDDRHYPIVLDQFMTGSEAEIDLVADGENTFIPEIMEHVEPAGVHSGDSMALFPAQNLSLAVKATLKDYAQKIVQKVNYKGLMNIQFLISEGTVYVLEVNPRASRTVPIISKVSDVSMVDLAVKVLVHESGNSLKDTPQPSILKAAVKYPLFSSHALPELDHKLGANMLSTGEGMCLADTAEEAMAKVFEHLPNLYEKENVCLIESDSFLKGKSSDWDFAEWLELKEAKVYMNNGNTEEDSIKRIQALKAGVTVFTQATTFNAYVDSLAHNPYQPTPLPGSKEKECV